MALDGSHVAGTGDHVGDHNLIDAALVGVGVSVANYGAVGDGVTNDSAAVLAAFNACPANGTVLFPAGKTYLVTTVALPAKPVTVVAYGSTIQTATAGTFAFTRVNRNRTTWLGGRFTGNGSGFQLNLAPQDPQSYDFAFSGVSFILPANQTALSMQGGREGTITDCQFVVCTGIRLTETVNVQIKGCQFQNCTKGVFAGGLTATAYNAGIMITSCTMLGCGVGVHVIGTDWVSIIGCMIDYCDQPVLLVNLDIATITSCYMSNRETGGTVTPTIQVLTDGAQVGNACQHIRISACTLLCNVVTLPQQAVTIRFSGGVTWASVTNCTLHFWRKYAVQVVGTSTYIKITGNDMVRVGTEVGAASVYGSGGNDGTWLIGDNYLSVPILNTVSPVLRNNFT